MLPEEFRGDNESMRVRVLCLRERLQTDVWAATSQKIRSVYNDYYDVSEYTTLDHLSMELKWNLPKTP